MEEKQVVEAFGALSNQTRLQVLRKLVEAGPRWNACRRCGAGFGRQPVAYVVSSFHVAGRWDRHL